MLARADGRPRSCGFLGPCRPAPEEATPSGGGTGRATSGRAGRACGTGSGSRFLEFGLVSLVGFRLGAELVIAELVLDRRSVGLEDLVGILIRHALASLLWLASRLPRALGDGPDCWATDRVACRAPV